MMKIIIQIIKIIKQKHKIIQIIIKIKKKIIIKIII